jgi:F-type H+-transporting ATPase subunit b
MAKIALFGAVATVLLSCGIAGAEQAAQAAETGAGEPNLFSGTFADSLWTVVAFVVLLVALGRLAWRPLLHALTSRENFIEQQLRSAEESRQRAEHMLEDYEQKGVTVLRQATEQAQRQLQEAAEKARQEALAIRRRAQEEIESARMAAVEELWKQAGDIIQRVGSDVLERALTEQDSQRLIDEAVTKIREGGGAR